MGFDGINEYGVLVVFEIRECILSLADETFFYHYICLSKFGEFNLKLHPMIQQSSTFNSSCRMYKLLKSGQR